MCLVLRLRNRIKFVIYNGEGGRISVNLGRFSLEFYLGLFRLRDFIFIFLILVWYFGCD